MNKLAQYFADQLSREIHTKIQQWFTDNRLQIKEIEKELSLELVEKAGVRSKTDRWLEIRDELKALDERVEELKAERKTLAAEIALDLTKAGVIKEMSCVYINESTDLWQQIASLVQEEAKKRRDTLPGADLIRTAMKEIKLNRPNDYFDETRNRLHLVFEPLSIKDARDKAAELAEKYAVEIEIL